MREYKKMEVAIIWSAKIVRLTSAGSV